MMTKSSVRWSIRLRSLQGVGQQAAVDYAPHGGWSPSRRYKNTYTWWNSCIPHVTWYD